MKVYGFAIVIVSLALLLAACAGAGNEADGTEITVMPDTTAAPENTEPSQTSNPTQITTVPETTAQPMLPEPEIGAAEPGYYLVSSVGENGDIRFYGDADPENGYLKLETDHSGVMFYNGTEESLTWDKAFLYWGEKQLPYAYMTYYDEELGREDSMLVLYFVEDGISVIMRPVEEPVS